MEKFTNADLDNDLLLDIDETNMDDVDELEMTYWEEQLESLEKFDLDIDEEL